MIKINLENIFAKIDIIKKNIINNLYKNRNNLDQFSDLTLKEFEILFLWQTYIALNNFFIKIRNLNNFNNIKQSNYREHIFYLFNKSEDIINKNYFDSKYNDLLVILLKKNLFDNEDINCRSVVIKKKVNIKTILKNIVYNYKVKNLKNKKFIFEKNKWLNFVFDQKNAFVDSENDIYKVDCSLRKKIIDCVFESFSRDMEKILLINDKKINLKLSKIFSELFNSFLSLTLIEGFEKKRNKYKNIINNNIKYLHTCNGFLLSDNFKIFAVCAKQRECILICHEHGVFNYLPMINKDKQKNYYKMHTNFQIADYYLTWANINSQNDIYEKVEEIFNVKILNIGSVYLNNLKKFINIKNNTKNTILYLDSPFRKFHITEIEDSFENINKRKLDICNLFLKLINYNQDIKIIYKPFPNNYFLNPIDQLIKKLPKRNFILDNSNSIKLMNKANLILSDSLSTAFAESLSMNKNMLIYGNEFEYNNASLFGKKINDQLFNEKKIFYDIDDLYKNINFFFNSKNNSKFSSSKAANDFRNSMAFSISKKNFLNKISNIS